jgi:hypothetical protein
VRDDEVNPEENGGEGVEIIKVEAAEPEVGSSPSVRAAVRGGRVMGAE